MSPTRKNRNGEGRILGVGLLNIVYSSLVFFFTTVFCWERFSERQKLHLSNPGRLLNHFWRTLVQFQTPFPCASTRRCWQICFYPHSRERSRESSTLDQYHAELRTNATCMTLSLLALAGISERRVQEYGHQRRKKTAAWFSRIPWK